MPSALSGAHRAHLIALWRARPEFSAMPRFCSCARDREGRDRATLRCSVGRYGSSASTASSWLRSVTPITLAGIDHAWRAAQSFCELLAAIDRVPTLAARGEGMCFRTQKRVQRSLQRFVRENHAVAASAGCIGGSMRPGPYAAVIRAHARRSRASRSSRSAAITARLSASRSLSARRTCAPCPRRRNACA